MAAPIELSTEDKLEYNFFPVTAGSLNFRVRASNDAHIALTSGPAESDPMYEVFIGGWGNTKSVIRRNRTKPDVVEANTPDILNGDEFRGFWIRWAGGHVTVGHDGDTSPFLDWVDPQPFGIGYYGICTGWGASGTWKIEGHAEVSTPDSLEYGYRPIMAGALEVDIRAPHNGHLALVSGPTETDPMYEIILGGWDNTASVIRYSKTKPDKVHVNTPNLLNAGDIRRFYIEWHKGRISVRANSRSGPALLEWQDDGPLFGISHFGVRTAWGSTGKWRVRPYDQRTGTASPSAPPSAGWTPGIPGAVCWCPARGGEAPPNGVVGGSDNGEPVYVARASHEGALLPGKLVPSHGVCYVPWGGAEHGKEEYEVLCDCPHRWVQTSGGQIPPGAVAGGQTEDGEPLFIGRADHNGTVTTGKVQSSHNVLYIPYGGEEVAIADFEVLVSQ